MRRPSCRPFVLVLAAIVALALLPWQSLAAASKSSSAKSQTTIGKRPPLDAIERVTLQHFRSMPDYRDGDLVSAGQVRTLFPLLAQLGWKVPGVEGILADVPTETEFLVQELRTPAGKRFMRSISRYSGAYDSLDRLSKLSYGKGTVRRLIKGPDGYKMIEYITSSSGGRELGDMLSEAPHGGQFNQPTGKLYTASLVMARLRRVYSDTSGSVAP